MAAHDLTEKPDPVPHDVTEKWHYDEMEDRLTIERTQEIGDVLDANKAAQADKAAYSAQKFKGDGYHHVAAIPVVVAEKIMREHGINIFDKNDHPRFMAILQSPEYAYLRTVNARF